MHLVASITATIGMLWFWFDGSTHNMIVCGFLAVVNYLWAMTEVEDEE
jgi:hypothetical protein